MYKNKRNNKEYAKSLELKLFGTSDPPRLRTRSTNQKKTVDPIATKLRMITNWANLKIALKFY